MIIGLNLEASTSMCRVKPLDHKPILDYLSFEFFKLDKDFFFCPHEIEPSFSGEIINKCQIIQETTLGSCRHW